MNLIEYLGLDFAKQIHRENLEEFLGDATGVTVGAKGIEFKHEELSEALLQYRREHNIFEVGDYIVDTVSNQFFKVVEVDGNNLLINNRFWVVAMYQRHATPEEIQTGERNV